MSQNRSFAVLDRALQAVGKNPLLSECLLNLASATGRGSQNAIELDGVYSPDQSRRVEIKIRVKSSDQAILKGIRKAGAK